MKPNIRKLKFVPHARKRLRQRFGFDVPEYSQLTYNQLEFVKRLSNNRKIHRIKGTDVYIIVKTDKAVILTVITKDFKNVR